MTRHGSNFGPMAAGAVIGFLAGLALRQARKAAIQAPAFAAGDWVEALAAEHRLLEALFDKLLATHERQVARREALLDRIAVALNHHAAQEEHVVYPALTEASRGDHARHLGQDHAEMKTMIYELRRLSAADPRWLLMARELHGLIEHHVREEEEDVFPAFRAAMCPEDNARLTRMMNREGFRAA